jgi:hypothetical protein
MLRQYRCRSIRSMHATWRPVRIAHGEMRSKLPDDVFAFPAERKEPLTDARHVRSAIARFRQVDGVDDRERALAFQNIKAAAHYYGISMNAATWHDLM